MAQSFDLIIFDCDGVLIDSEVISARVLTAALAELGIALTLSFFTDRFLGRSFPTVRGTIRDTWGTDLPDGFEETFRTRLLTAFAAELAPMPGIASILAALAVPACVATSSSPARAAQSLAQTGLAGFFGANVFTAAEVVRGKPAPDLFLHAARRMGTAPARTLVIEDSLPGLVAARAAGMTVWHFTGGSHMAGAQTPPPPEAAPHATLADFARMRDLCPALFKAPA